MNNLKYVSVSLVIGLLIGRFLLQQKPQVIEKIKTVEIEKVVKVEDKKKREVRKEITKPDGTKEVTVTIDENTNTREDKDRTLVVKSDKITKGSGITLGMLAIKDSANLSGKTEYGLNALVPIYGAVKLQVMGTSDKRIAVGFGVDL